MSKENLDSYELFFAEIPQYTNDYLSEIIRRDSAQDEEVQLEESSSLSPEQVERLAEDSRELSDQPPTPIIDNGDTLFS